MNTIPLHLLPDEAFKSVLQSMEIYDQLAYSFCSRNTKKAIKSLNLTAEKISLYISNNIGFEILFENSTGIWTYMNHGYYFPNKEFSVPKCIQVDTSARINGILAGWKIKPQNFGVRDWLHHFCEVLHHPKIDDLFFNGDEIEDDFIEPVQKIIKGLQLGYNGFGDLLTPEFTKKALESFKNYEELHLDRVPFNKNKVQRMNKFLIQNLSEICIRGAKRLTIDQVLLSNSENIQLREATFTDKDLKIFLKLWIRGSNPRLKHFYTWRKGIPELALPFHEQVFFKGINRTKIPKDSLEVYREKVHKNYYEETKLAGGSRIRRYDGTTAVVLIKFFDFEVIVNA